jgi:hypothetical protein
VAKKIKGMGCGAGKVQLDQHNAEGTKTERRGEDVTPEDRNEAETEAELEASPDKSVYTGYIPKSRIEVKYDTTIKRNLEVNLTHDELKDDLKPLNFGPLVQEKCDQYMPGTRTWIFKDAKTWLADTKGNRVFWLAGDGGTVSLSISA